MLCGRQHYSESAGKTGGDIENKLNCVRDECYSVNKELNYWEISRKITKKYILNLKKIWSVWMLGCLDDDLYGFFAFCW